jgi:hypothetical protein
MAAIEMELAGMPIQLASAESARCGSESGVIIQLKVSGWMAGR